MFRPFDRDKDYSEAERKLFDSTGYGDLMNSLSAPDLYRLAVTKAFQLKWDYSDKRQSLAEAIRKGSIALDNCSPFRMTPEFDELLRF